MFQLGDDVDKFIVDSTTKMDSDSPGHYQYWNGKVSNRIDVGRNAVILEVTFNSKLHSWDYDYQSNRWRIDERHVIHVYAFVEQRVNVYTFVGECIGPEFQIFSSKSCHPVVVTKKQFPSLRANVIPSTAYESSVIERKRGKFINPEEMHTLCPVAGNLQCLQTHFMLSNA